MENSIKMVSEMSKVKKKIHLTVCDGCLSTDRKLSSIDDHIDLFNIIVGEEIINLRNMTKFVKPPKLCWECCSMLKTARKFQKRVEQAQMFLHVQADFEKEHFSNLSNLVIKINDVTTFVVDDGELEVDVKLEEEPFHFEDVDVKSDHETEFIDDKELKAESNSNKKEKSITNIDNVFKTESNEIDMIYKKDKRVKMTNARFRLIFFSINRKEFKKQKLSRIVPISEDEMAVWREKAREGRNYKLMKYRCELCITGYAKEKYYKAHMDKSHSQKNLHECNICKIRFATKTALKHHIKKHYVKYVCLLCDFECYKYCNLYNHFQYAHKRLVECLKCGMQFDQRRDFYKHHRDIHANFTCDHCGLRFSTRGRIINHLKVKHGSTRCEICNVEYSKYHGLARHISLHHVKKATEESYCVECNIQFDNMTLYERHLKRSVKHGGRRGFPCPACDKIYSKKTAMSNHYKYFHLQQTKYYCEKCARYFLNGYRLRTHIATFHEKVQPPKNKLCVYCGRGFATNRVLENHIRTHTGERPFACDHCSATFAQRQALISHTRAIHKIRIK